MQKWTPVQMKEMNKIGVVHGKYEIIIIIIILANQIIQLVCFSSCQ